MALAGMCVLFGCDPGAFDALVGPPAQTTEPPAGVMPARPLDAGAGAEGQDASDAGDDEGDSGATPGSPACPVASDPAAVTFRTRELSIVPRAASVDWRIGAASIRLGEQVLWLFHKPVGAVALWGRAPDFLADPPRVGAGDGLALLLPDVAEDTSSFLTGGLVARGDREALLFFGLYEGLTARAAGLARIALGAERAEILRAPGELFGELAPVAGTPAFAPLFHTGAFLDDSATPPLIYVFGCQPNPAAADEQQGGVHEQPCRIARVAASAAEDGTRYRYWDGAQWTADRARAAVVIDHVQAEALSVSYNRYLARYLAVHSANKNHVMLRHAPRPEGPWQTLGEFTTAPAVGGFGITHSALEHVSLKERCDQVTYISYARPVELTLDGGTQAGYETRLVRVELH